MPSIKFGEIDATQIIENEYRIGVLEQVVNLMMQRNPAGGPNAQEMGQIRAAVIRRLQEKYPKSGIGLTAGSGVQPK